MKKLFLVLIAAVSTAASAQVTVYGRINATVDSTKTGSAKVNSMVNDVSRIGFRITEDLGNGLLARAVIETSVASNDPVAGDDTKLGNRTSTLGLGNKVGSVDLGRNLHSVFTTVAGGDNFGVLYGSVATDVHNLRGNRLGNAVFARVNVLPGISLGMDRTHTATGTEAVIYSAAGQVAGVNVAAARFEQGTEKSLVASANVTRGNTSLFYSYSDNEGATAHKGNLLGVSQKIGATTFKAGYGKTNTDVKAYNIGAEYALSKRTEVLVSYRNVDRAGATNDVSQVGVGLTHRF